MSKKGKRRKGSDPFGKDVLMGNDVPVVGIGNIPAGGGKFPKERWPDTPYGKADKFPVNKFPGA